jgi:hypothetical protein
MVGDTGLVVKPRSPGALAYACSGLIDDGAEGRARRGAAARQRVIEHYGMARVTDSYHALYLDVLTTSRAQRPHAPPAPAGRRPRDRTVAVLASAEPL